MEKSYLIILAVAIIGDVQSTWLNSLDRPLFFECPVGQSIYKIRSKHHNRQEDREWDLQCRDSNARGSCFWTGFLNRFDGFLSHRCPNNAVISGMYSEHSNHHEDRVFKVKCCSVTGYTLRNCLTTPYVNDWDAMFTYNVQTGHHLIGIQSIHHNHYEDRRFRFTVCQAKNNV